MLSLPKILIVDDDESVQISLALLLKQNSYATTTCDEPSQALALRRQQTFSLALLDMNFPQTTGEEGLALMAEIHRRQPELPVLLMTAWVQSRFGRARVKSGLRISLLSHGITRAYCNMIQTTLSLAH